MIQEGYNNIIESELNDAVDFAVASKKRKSITLGVMLFRRMAATYFSTNKCSIIGDVRLNFSVRNGKRCSLTL